jgi:hypothetical protein
VFSLANSFKSSLVAVLLVGAFGGLSAPAGAATPTRVSNCRSGVCTRVILGHNDDDQCVVSNSNNTAVIAYVAVSPWTNGGVATVGPIILGVFGQRQVFAWTPEWHNWSTYTCQVTSVQ